MSSSFLNLNTTLKSLTQKSIFIQMNEVIQLFYLTKKKMNKVRFEQKVIFLCLIIQFGGAKIRISHGKKTN